MRASRPIVTALTTAVAAVLALGVGAPAASAHGSGHGPSSGWLTGGSYYQKPAPYDLPGEFSEDCGDFSLDVTGRYTGVDWIRNVPGTGGQAFLAGNRYRFLETWRNPANGKWFTVRGAGYFEERAAKYVPRWKVPADAIPPSGLVGPVYRFLSTDTGVQFWMKDSRGRTVAKEAGTIVQDVMFDTLGDRTPGAEFLTEVSIKLKGSYDTFYTSVCDLARPLVADPV